MYRRRERQVVSIAPFGNLVHMLLVGRVVVVESAQAGLLPLLGTQERRTLDQPTLATSREFHDLVRHLGLAHAIRQHGVRMRPPHLRVLVINRLAKTEKLDPRSLLRETERGGIRIVDDIIDALHAEDQHPQGLADSMPSTSLCRVELCPEWTVDVHLITGRRPDVFQPKDLTWQRVSTCQSPIQPTTSQPKRRP